MNDPTPAPAPRRPRPAARFALAALKIGGVAYAALTLILWWVQERLIFPGQASQGQGWAKVNPGPGEELVRLALPGGEQVVALFGKALGPRGGDAPDPKSCPTILFFYGNGECLQSARGIQEFLRGLGANVLVPDYPGYGMSEGKPGEAPFARAAEAALDHLLARADIDPGRIAIGGFSIGAASALKVAARPEVAGVFTLDAFTSMVEMARRQYPFLPIRLLLRHPFDNGKAIARVTCPILIGHGDRDGLVPPAMADELAKLAGGPVTQFSIPGADHNDAFEADPPLVRDAISRWLATLSPRR
jgi:pimeloyl-ACP methyl ester carboxylesterase